MIFNSISFPVDSHSLFFAILIILYSNIILFSPEFLKAINHNLIFKYYGFHRRRHFFFCYFIFDIICSVWRSLLNWIFFFSSDTIIMILMGDVDDDYMMLIYIFHYILYLCLNCFLSHTRIDFSFLINKILFFFTHSKTLSILNPFFWSENEIFLPNNFYFFLPHTQMVTQYHVIFI